MTKTRISVKTGGLPRRLIFAALGLAFGVSACASSGASGAAAGPAASAYAGPLMGLSPRQVEARLGKANLVRDEGEGALWTYRFPNCALLVGFSGPKNARQVTALDAGPKQTGGLKPAREACLAEALR